MLTIAVNLMQKLKKNIILVSFCESLKCVFTTSDLSDSYLFAFNFGQLVAVSSETVVLYLWCGLSCHLVTVFISESKNKSSHQSVTRIVSVSSHTQTERLKMNFLHVLPVEM